MVWAVQGLTFGGMHFSLFASIHPLISFIMHTAFIPTRLKDPDLHMDLIRDFAGYIRQQGRFCQYSVQTLLDVWHEYFTSRLYAHISED